MTWSQKQLYNLTDTDAVTHLSTSGPLGNDVGGYQSSFSSMGGLKEEIFIINAYFFWEINKSHLSSLISPKITEISNDLWNTPWNMYKSRHLYLYIYTVYWNWSRLTLLSLNKILVNNVQSLVCHVTVLGLYLLRYPWSESTYASVWGTAAIHWHH